MKVQRKNKNYSNEDWSHLEGFLTRNFQPVDPRAGFINDLRKNLETVGSNTREGIEKTKMYVISVFALVTGLTLIALFIRFVVFLISSIKMHRYKSHYATSTNSVKVTGPIILE